MVAHRLLRLSSILKDKDLRRKRRGFRPMITDKPNKIITVARTLINTPYLHQGREPGVGLDCLGVVELTAILCGITYSFVAPTNYGRNSSRLLADGLERYCEEIGIFLPGTIVLCNLSTIPYHCGIITDYQGRLGLLHAYENAGRVREHALIPWWKDKIYKVYKFPGVEY